MQNIEICIYISHLKKSLIISKSEKLKLDSKLNRNCYNLISVSYQYHI